MIKLFKLIFLSAACWLLSALACTSFMFFYQHQAIIGRNFDWPEDRTDLVIHPIGEINKIKNLANAAIPLTWKSKYGAVTFDLSTLQNKSVLTAVQGGMNQVGLVASLLELSDSVYPKIEAHRPTIYNTQLIQYWLEEYKNVNQVIKATQKINVVPLQWQGQTTPVHFMVYDASGDIAIIEYLKGKLVIIHGAALSPRILTNTSYKQALKNLKTYQYFGGNLPLPLDTSSQARFVRAAVFLKNSLPPQTEMQAIHYAFAALQVSAEPKGSAYPSVWSVVYNTKTLKLYYRTLDKSNIQEIDFNKLKFDRSSKTLVYSQSI